ncbi:MAG TPA: GntR family transcriptional regulator [Candidatus Hydrogenedentes bacterium]|nr:GntR family transcriptional regulator [Candidatus Hydrogenedentota bacterium]HPG66806.1 GntR family transcriptional regulator [Candidatus Hydrogenedentota bacterium]
MLTSVDIMSSVAVYLQIENHVQFAIASGRLKSMDRLPSVREVSQRLGVNPNTVAKAYRDLEVMGLLRTRRGMGAFISKGVEAKCREDCRRRIISRFRQVAAEAKAAGMDPIEFMEITQACLQHDGNPYGPTPSALLSLVEEE